MYNIEMKSQIDLQKLGALPFSHDVLMSLLADYQRPNDKISNLVADQTLIAIKRGFYVVNPEKTGEPISLPLIANLLYGPSYVSLDYALSYYGLIPEAVYEITSVTTQRSKAYDTPVGRFTYTHADSSVYSIGISSVTNEAGHQFLMASPEKALCDKLIQIPNLVINSPISMFAFLDQDLRLDINEFARFDRALIQRIAAVGVKSRLLQTLHRTLETIYGHY
jgi:predicted transcriptional regulator of viral defense system